VLGLFAEKDGFVSPEVARGVEAAIKKAGKQVEIKIYPGRDHAFFNDENKAAYHQADADDAWKRTTEFFKKHLK
jgi:carboxymethylenebutenolidase